MANRLSNGPMQVTNLTVEELNYCFQRVRQELDELRGLRGPIAIHDTITGLTLAESQITFTDITTGNVTSTKHGFAPKSPADAAKFLNGDTTPDYALVKDSDLSTSDITTNNASTVKHGFLKKLSGAATDFLDGTGAFDTVKDSDLSTSDITTNNATTSKHGFTPKYPNDATKYLDGTGAYTVPAGGSAVTDATISTSDITTNNVSTTKHGWTPKLPNDATKYLDGTGGYTVPAGSGGGSATLGNLYPSATISSTEGTMTSDSGNFTVGMLIYCNQALTVSAVKFGWHNSNGTHNVKVTIWNRGASNSSSSSLGTVTNNSVSGTTLNTATFSSPLSLSAFNFYSIGVYDVDGTHFTRFTDVGYPGAPAICGPYTMVAQKFVAGDGDPTTSTTVERYPVEIVF